MALRDCIPHIDFGERMWHARRVCKIFSPPTKGIFKQFALRIIDTAKGKDFTISTSLRVHIYFKKV